MEKSKEQLLTDSHIVLDMASIVGKPDYQDQFSIQWLKIPSLKIVNEQMSKFLSKQVTKNNDKDKHIYSCSPFDYGCIIIARIYDRSNVSKIQRETSNLVKQIKYGPIKAAKNIKSQIYQNQDEQIQVVLNKSEYKATKLQIMIHENQTNQSNEQIQQNKQLSLKLQIQKEEIQLKFSYSQITQGENQIFKLYGKQQNMFGIYIYHHYRQFMEFLKKMRVNFHYGKYLKICCSDKNHRDTVLFKIISFLSAKRIDSSLEQVKNSQQLSFNVQNQQNMKKWNSSSHPIEISQHNFKGVSQEEYSNEQQINDRIALPHLAITSIKDYQQQKQKFGSNLLNTFGKNMINIYSNDSIQFDETPGFSKCSQSSPKFNTKNVKLGSSQKNENSSSKDEKQLQLKISSEMDSQKSGNFNLEKDNPEKKQEMKKKNETNQQDNKKSTANLTNKLYQNSKYLQAPAQEMDDLFEALFQNDKDNYLSEVDFYLSPSEHLIQDIYNILYTPYSKGKQRKSSFSANALFLKQSVKLQSKPPILQKQINNEDKEKIKKQLRETLKQKKTNEFRNTLQFPHMKIPVWSQKAPKYDQQAKSKQTDQFKLLNTSEDYDKVSEKIGSKVTATDNSTKYKYSKAPELSFAEYSHKEAFLHQKISYLTKLNQQLMKQNIHLKATLQYQRLEKQKLDLIKMSEIRQMAINMVKRLETVDNINNLAYNENFKDRYDRQIIQANRSQVKNQTKVQKSSKQDQERKYTYASQNDLIKSNRMNILKFRDRSTSTRKKNSHSKQSKKGKKQTENKKSKKKINSQDKSKRKSYEYPSQFLRQCNRKRFETSDQAFSPGSPREKARQSMLKKFQLPLKKQLQKANNCSPDADRNGRHQKSQSPKNNLIINPSSYLFNAGIKNKMPNFLKKRASIDPGSHKIMDKQTQQQNHAYIPYNYEINKISAVNYQPENQYYKQISHNYNLSQKITTPKLINSVSSQYTPKISMPQSPTFSTCNSYSQLANQSPLIYHQPYVCHTKHITPKTFPNYEAH